MVRGATDADCTVPAEPWFLLLLLLSDSVQSQPGEGVLHRGCGGGDPPCSLPRLLLHPQPLRPHQGGQAQVSPAVCLTLLSSSSSFLSFDKYGIFSLFQ